MKPTAAKRREILSLPIPELSQQLKDGKLSAVQVLQAFQEKATLENERLNCLTEPVPDALARAKDLDAGNGKRGLLHGVPMSFKDNINIKGMSSTMGVTKHLDSPAEEDAVIVQVLKKQGAVPFVKTNIPQTLLSFACSNPVFGETVNPADPARTPGGSSGGEGALIGSGGSILGVGGDIAGSVRIPAHFCGVCGFKPTANRISAKGVKSGSPGQQGVVASPGLLARDMDSLVLGMKALLVPDMFHLDPQVVPMPFRQEMYEDKKPMRIGYFTTLETCPPTPSMGRAVIMAKEALEKAGHTVTFRIPQQGLDVGRVARLLTSWSSSAMGQNVEGLVAFDPPDQMYALLDLAHKLLSADCGQTVKTNWLNGEIVDDRIKALVRLLTMPYYVRKILGFLLKPIIEYIQTFMTGWRERELDVMLCSSFGMPACKPEDASLLTSAASYTLLFNLLNFPAGVVPVTTVTEEDDSRLDDTSGDLRTDPLIRKFACVSCIMIYKACCLPQTTKGGVGLPVAVQCVALPWQEERCLRLMKEVETLCGL
ncbi:fatty-acid amide hydrolase 1-like [Branchiostoma lanceolatum]|uniref:fatty-acid amide hydrolase 1-like n=1 Tax=Branchiostoma lanceolatum TaxID=7740 RepID=UPI003452633E